MRLSQDVLEILTAYEWPGNVRELVNCARYVSNLCQGDVIQSIDLPQRLRDLARASTGLPLPASPVSNDRGGEFRGPSIRYELPYKQAKRLWLEVFEYAYITSALKQHGGNVSHAAKAAGIDRKSIQRLMKRNQMEKLGESVGGSATDMDSDG